MWKWRESFLPEIVTGRWADPLLLADEIFIASITSGSGNTNVGTFTYGAQPLKRYL